MNAITGDYDVVIQIQESVVNDIFSAMHAAGAVQHRFVFAYQDQRIDLQMGRPSIVLSPVTPADQRPRALATARVLVQSRPLADASALGTVRVATITARAALACVPGASSSDQMSIQYDWAETTAADIVLAGSPDDPNLRDMLAKVIGRIRGSNPAGSG
jgi:hypothetical protein